MDGEILTLIDAPSKRSFERKCQRWLEFSATNMLGIRCMNIHDLPIDEIIDATIETMKNHDIQKAAVSSLETISKDMREAVHWASAVVDAGRKICMVSYAEGNPALVEIKPAAIQYMLDTDKFFLIEPADVLFLQSYLEGEVNLAELYSFLSALESSFDPEADDVFLDTLAGDIRRAAIMAQLIEYKERKKGN